MIDPNSPDFRNSPVSPDRPVFGYQPGSVEPPVVSIITPYFNTGDVFHETARSIFGQSFQQWEWIIVNDASTEPDSLANLDRYRSCDPRIRIIDKPSNEGLGAARNTGFKQAKCEYLVQIDSDDLLEPTAVEKWLWFLVSYPEFSFVKGYTVGFGSQEYLWTRGFHEKAIFLKQNLVCATAMLRKEVFSMVGGYRCDRRGGFEDWDFWLRCANGGFWGATVPEFLDWYRRRADHGDRWSEFNQKGMEKFRREARKFYPRLLHPDGFPEVVPRWHFPNEPITDSLPFENRLQSSKPRLLMIVPHMTLGGADKFNHDLVQQLTRRGWEVSIVTTLQGDHSWMPQFAKHTPDIFPLGNFLRPSDYPRFLRYLIQSREIGTVMATNSEFGYSVLPYLRAHFPRVIFLDLSHMEEEYWKNGGYPRMAINFQETVDLSIVVSEHLKRWMVSNGGEESRIATCYLNVDTEKWKPDLTVRERLRQELKARDDEVILLYAGRICAQKQPEVFAETMLKLREQGEKFLALVAGHGEDFPFLENFVRRNRLGSCVRLLGGIESERVRELMQSADIFFLPSLWEGIALSIYEAMACGLPVVGADVGGQKELVTDECGFLVSTRDKSEESTQYANILSQLIRSTDLRRTMGQECRSRVERYFRIEQMGDRMIELFGFAGELSRTDPRPPVGQGLGVACATQAVELARIQKMADDLWMERERFRAILGRLPVSIEKARSLYRLYAAVVSRLSRAKRLLGRLSI